ncbi:MAG: sugar phosphate isomerase/epimerase [Verrucomicrobia bacterium]|nr:sugar phosphate isomerase/epimerase [Verrucomicrobiota bacterium]
MNEQTSRRKFIGTLTGATLSAGILNTTGCAKPGNKIMSSANFKYCFNTSTIRGQELGLVKEIEIAAKAGYNAIEPWIRSIRAFLDEGGSLKDLNKRIQDLGLTVESAIGFAEWIVDDPVARAKGLEEAKSDMDILSQIGGIRIAAPPKGATKEAGLDLLAAAERYRALLELGDKMGVVPMVEVWGFSKNLHRLGQAVFVAIESGHPKACVLPDVYHLYKGGSDFTGLQMLSKNSVHAIHINDYPADPPWETIGDKDRVYPGDGIAPLGEIFRTLAKLNPDMVFSLELFNPNYWEQDALEVAKTGLAKMKEQVAAALG